jgi:hypothetical protein
MHPPQIIDQRERGSKAARPVLVAHMVGLANRLIGEMDTVIEQLLCTGEVSEENLGSIASGEVEKGATTVKDDICELTSRATEFGQLVMSTGVLEKPPRKLVPRVPHDLPESTLATGQSYRYGVGPWTRREQKMGLARNRHTRQLRTRFLSSIVASQSTPAV